MNKKIENTVPCRACRGNPDKPHPAFSYAGLCTVCGASGHEAEEALLCQNSHQLLVRVGLVPEDYPGQRDELDARY